MEPETCSAVVVGSGFGGTISALTLSNYFEEKNKGKQQGEKQDTVCILERGQWWVSHEIPYTSGKKLVDQNMLEYLVDNKKPFSFWAHPDNIEGLFSMISMSRIANSRGLYDFHLLSPNVNAITASGIGGGSLVYSNVTIKPDRSTYEKWSKEKPGDELDVVFDQTTETYFSYAEKFIGVNKITTNAGLAGQILERSKIFQTATDVLANHPDTKILNKGDYGLNLSITDVPNKLFDNLTPEIIQKYQGPMQTNVCQRQARCNIGCIPGARHTLNKRLHIAIKNGKPLEVRPLCEATKIDYDETDKDFPYLIKYEQFNTETGKSETKEIKTARLIISSGALGSTELLLKSKNDKLKLSDKLGHRFSTNADLLAYMELKTKEVDNTRGPINTSHAEFKTETGKFGFNIEDTAVPSMVVNVFAMIFENPTLTKGIGFLQSFRMMLKMGGLRRKLFFKTSISSSIMTNILNWFLQQKVIQDLISQPMVVKNNQVVREIDENIRNELTPLYAIANWILVNKQRLFDSPAQRLSRFFIFSCMGIDNSDGILKLNNKDQKFKIGGNLELDWDPKKNEKIFNDIMKGVKDLANAIEPNGSTTVKSPTWKEESPSDSNLILLHPLGGCAIGNTIDDGVVNCYGQVFKPNPANKKDTYSNFYVVDGSIIPMAVGVNPSLTIMALAFRCAENMVNSKKYWP